MLVSGDERDGRGGGGGSGGGGGGGGGSGSGSGGSGGAAPVSYSSNWAGAVLVGSGYTSVVGTIKVPVPRAPQGGDASTTYSTSAWVGLDGDTCQTSILQTGVDFTISGGVVSYDAWYEWFPDYAYNFADFLISAGDEIRMTANASSTTSGSVTLENLTTLQQVSHAFSAQSAALCETNAEWIVEDYEENGALVPFANFGSVTFSDCSVGTTAGKAADVSGSEILDIKQNSKVLTDCSTSGTSTVTCQYTGQ